MAMGSLYIDHFELNDGTSVQVGDFGNFNGNVDEYVSDDITGDYPKTPKAPTFIPYTSILSSIPIASDVRDTIFSRFTDYTWEDMEDLENSLAEGGQFHSLVSDIYWILGSPLTGGLGLGNNGTDLYLLSINGFVDIGNGNIQVGKPGTNSITIGSPTVDITNANPSLFNSNVAALVPPSGTYSKGLMFYNIFRWNSEYKSLIHDGFCIDYTSVHRVGAGHVNPGDFDTGIDDGYIHDYWTSVGEYIVPSWNFNFTEILPSLQNQITNAFKNARTLQFNYPDVLYPGTSTFGPFSTTNGAQIEGTSFFSGEVTEYESDNPYETPGGGPGGGFGDQNRYSQDTLPEGIPGLDLLNSGFVKLYHPTKAQLSEFANFLFSSITDNMSAVFKRMVSNPLDYIISLHMIHIPLHGINTSEIGFCGIGSGVVANEVDKQYYEIEYQLQINEFWKSALDYTNYTKGKIYIPYCGIYDINIDEFMNGTMFLRYVIDCVSGACVAFLGTKRLQKDGQTYLRATLYQFNGNCILSMPVSSTNWQGVFQSIMSIATTAVAPGTSALSGMANDILGQKISVQKSGSLASNYGYLGKQKPFVIIERPELSMPKNYGNNFGFPANEYVLLGNCNGFTAVDTNNGIILDDIRGITPEEADELKTLLSNGVYF